jgi:hypothetical protein
MLSLFWKLRSHPTEVLQPISLNFFATPLISEIRIFCDFDLQIIPAQSIDILISHRSEFYFQRAIQTKPLVSYFNFPL